MVDWYPTLLKLAGASLAQKLPLDGRDAWPTIAEGKPSPHEEILLNATPARGDPRRRLEAGDQRRQRHRPKKWTPEAGQGGNKAEKGRRDRRARRAVQHGPGPLREAQPRRPSTRRRSKELRARYDALARQAVPPKTRPQPPGFQSPKVWGQRE